MIPSTWVATMACLPDRVWRYSRSCGLFFERKCFPDRLGLGLVLPLYLNNDSFGNSPETSRFFIYVSMVMSCIRNKICIFAILMTDTRIL